VNRRTDIRTKNICKIKHAILFFLLLINILKIEKLGLIQATEIESFLRKSNIYQQACADTNTDLQTTELFPLVRYVKKEEPIISEQLFTPIQYTLTEDHAFKINHFVNNQDSITHNDNLYDVFHDILYLDITQNNIQDFIAKYLFIDLFNKIKGEKLHLKLSWLICSKYTEERDIDDWLDRFFTTIHTILPTYYETTKSIEKSTNDRSKLFIKFDFNQPLFRTTFFEIIQAEYLFYQSNLNAYVKHKNELFLKNDNACVELFPLSLEKNAADKIDFTLYPIKHAQTWLYKKSIGYSKVILNNYIHTERPAYRKTNKPEIGSYGYIIEDIRTIIIDASNLKKIKLQKLLGLFPSLEKIILKNSTKKPLFLSSTECYILLKKNLKKSLFIEGIKSSAQSIFIQGNVHVTTKHIIKSFIKFWVMPNDWVDDTCDYIHNGVCIGNIFIYTIVLLNKISQMNGNEGLFYFFPLAIIFFSPFLLSDQTITQILLGNKTGDYIGDHQHWTFYAWQKALIYLINIYWCVLITQKLSLKDTILGVPVVFNALVQGAFLLGSGKRLIDIIKIAHLCWQAKSYTPYIQKDITS
jgi:hypothetical protein